MLSRFSILNSPFRNAERGYTLAGLLVILTVLAVVLSFSVPRMWSDVMKRERELHTIFVMKQYAQAISDYQRIKGALPTTLEQLEKQTMPRVLRSTYVNPLSGELDWIMVPEGTLTPAGAAVAVGAPGVNQPGAAPGQPPTTGLEDPNKPKDRDALPPPKPRDFVGPFIGVRPPQSGASMIELFDRTDYSEWMYTLNELRAEQQAASQPGVPAGGPQGRN